VPSISSPAIDENAIVYLLLSDEPNPASEDVFFVSSVLSQTDGWIQSTIDFSSEMPGANYFGILFFSGKGFDEDGEIGSVLLLDDVTFLSNQEGCEFVLIINEGNVTTCFGSDLVLTTQNYDNYQRFGSVDGEEFFFIDDTEILDSEDAEEGEYFIFVMATIDNCTVSSDTINIIIEAGPEPVIVQDGNILTTENGMISYIWYYNGGIIGTTETVEIKGNGNYTVFVESDEGCSGQSDDFIVTGVGIGELELSFNLYHNPVFETLYLQVDNVYSLRFMIC